MLKRIASLAPALVALFLLIACGPPSMEGQISAFQRNIDQMDALAAKNPQFKPSIDAKKMEFKAEFETLKNGVGEEGARALAALNGRVSRFMNELVPKPPAGVRTQPGQKLGTTSPGQPTATQPMGGKVGQPAGVPVQPGMTPPPVPTQPVPSQPTGGSGFGGAATTTPPVPAQPVQPVPAQPTGGSGFGGK
jgi:hypothetical protein